MRTWLEFRFEMDIESIRLGPGPRYRRGVAANALCAPLPRLQLLKYAMEARSSQAAPRTSTISPLLFGGLTLTVASIIRGEEIPVPPSLRCSGASAHVSRDARGRAILKTDVTRSDFVWASANLADSSAAAIRTIWI